MRALTSSETPVSAAAAAEARANSADVRAASTDCLRMRLRLLGECRSTEFRLPRRTCAAQTNRAADTSAQVPLVARFGLESHCRPAKDQTSVVAQQRSRLA